MLSPYSRVAWAFGFLIVLAGQSLALAADADKPRLDPNGEALPTEALTRLGSARLRAEEDLQTCVTLSPDSNTVVVSSAREGVVLYNRISGRELKRFWDQQMHPCGQPVFSGDGTKLGIPTTEAFVLLDIPSGKRIGQVEKDLRQPRTAVFSLDGKRLVVANPNPNWGPSLAEVWDVDTLKRVNRMLAGQADSLYVALSGDGKVLVTWGRHPPQKNEKNMVEAGTIQVWDLSTAKEQRRLKVDASEVQIVTCSPDGRQLAVVDSQFELSIWDVESGKKLQHADLRGNDGLILCYSSDGKRLAAGTKKGVVKIWDVETFKPLPETSRPGCPVQSLVFLPDNKVLAAGMDGLAVCLWEAPSGRRLTSPEGHTRAVTALAFAANGRTLFSGGQDGVRVWDLVASKTVRHFPRSNAGEDTLEPFDPPKWAGLDLAPDGRFALYGVNDGSDVRAIDTASGKKLYKAHDWGPGFGEVRATFSADGSVAATIGWHCKGGIGVWDVIRGRKLFTVKTSGMQGAAAVSPDGKAVLTAEPDSEGTQLILWNVSNGTKNWTHKVAGAWLLRLAFSPAGEVFAAYDGSDEIGLQLYDTQTGKPLQSLHKERHWAAVDPLVFSADGRTLAEFQFSRERGAVGKVVLWEVATGGRRCEFIGHRGEVLALAFSPDGRVLASGGADTSVLLWDLTGQFNREVQTQGRPKPAVFDTLWKQLDDGNAEKAYRLIQCLVAHPAEAVALVKAKLPPAKKKLIDAAELEKLIADLDHDEFERREKASKALAEIGKPASAALTKALQATQSAEKKRRLTELLDALKAKDTRPEMVRPTRALEVLERLATPEAKQLLEELAKGDPEAPLTQDAKATLKRLGSSAP